MLRRVGTSLSQASCCTFCIFGNTSPSPASAFLHSRQEGGGAAEIPPSNAWHVLKSAPCEAGLAGHLLPSSPREMTKVLRCLTSVVVVVVRVSWLALASERFAGTQQRQ